MTDNKALQDAASAWIAALTGRGVTLAARGKQLLMSPKSAYGEMTNEERATLKQHKHAIIALVKDGLPVTVNAVTAHAVTHAVASTPTPAPPPWCRFCMTSPCIGPDHPAFAALHFDDVREVERRGALATQELFAQVGKPQPAWWAR